MNTATTTNYAARPTAANTNTAPRIPCSCTGSCVLCDDNGLRPIDRTDVVKLRRYSLNRRYESTVRMCDRALADDDDAIAWHECAEALR